jgi:purine-binding chemotaxis protein CheW
MTTLTAHADSSPVHAAPQPPAQRAPDMARLASPGEYLMFRLGGEEYGVTLGSIQEIRGYQPPTRIAGAPDDICGVLNLRGVIVPIVDLRLRFQLDARIDTSTVIVVVNVRDSTVGVVVDAVSDAMGLTKQDIKPAPALGSLAGVDHITGIAVVDRDAVSRIFILLDIEHLVSAATLQAEFTAPTA